MLEFQQKYIEDASDLIAKLEAELINFENDVTNEAIIQELFRVMHTLKGSAGMFGFHRIEEFTHHLEDIYDLVRNKKLTVTRNILDLTFVAIDFIKLLLSSKEKLSKGHETVFSELLTQAKQIANKAGTTEPIPTETKAEKQTINIHRVLFKPEPTILHRGIKPYNLVEELKELGKCISFEFTDQTIDATDTKLFNKYFEFFLEASINYDDITDVFLFLAESEYAIECLDSSTNESIDDFLQNSEAVKNGTPLHDLKKQIEETIGSIEADAKPETKPDIAPIEAHQQITVPNDDSIRVSANKLDSLLNLVSELVIVHAQFESLSKEIKNDRLARTVKTLSKISRNFRNEILTTRLIPIAVLATGMQRLVRDLSHKLGKEVELIAEGLQTELDKNIINRIENPLMHILRNCIDHGLETPEERTKNDKPTKGIIRFIAFYSGASVFIQIQDDGRGIDTKYVFEKAVSKGMVKYDAVLSHKQIYEFLFIPGFSTAKEISEISGRGVGLDVVKNVITELHGEINVDSEMGLGTSFTFKLPLTLSIIDALLVHVNRYKILIPTSNILICKHLSSTLFTGNHLQYELGSKCVPVKRLSDLFETRRNETEYEVLIVISIYEKLFGLLVDKIITSLQAVIKPLGEIHKHQTYFIGASQLGDGSMAYILDTNFLLRL